MIAVLLTAVLLLGIATLVVAYRALLSSRRFEDLAADRHELLREQNERLMMLHEERQVLREGLERESQERQQFLKLLEARPHLVEDLKRERQELVESLSRTEQQKQERLEQDGQQTREDLEREREERLKAQQQLEHLEQERLHLEQRFERLREELENQGRQQEARRPWWRKPIVVAALLLGLLVMWLISLLVALNLLQ